MPVKNKVYFDDDGKVCPRDPVKAHKIPGCDEIDRNKEPFVPHNRPRPPLPSRKFKQFVPRDKPEYLKGLGSRTFDPHPKQPRFGKSPVFAVGPGVDPQTDVLPQDETNKNLRPRGTFDISAPSEIRSGRYVPVPMFEEDVPRVPIRPPKRTLDIEEGTVEETAPLTTQYKRGRMSDLGLRQRRAQVFDAPEPPEPPVTAPTLRRVSSTVAYTGKRVARGTRMALQPDPTEGFTVAEETVFERTPATPRAPSRELFRTPPTVRRQASAPPVGRRTLENIDRITSQVVSNIQQNLTESFRSGYERVLSDAQQIQDMEMMEEGLGQPPPEPPPSPPPPGVRKAKRITNPFMEQPSRLVSEVGTELIDYVPRRVSLEPMEIETVITPEVRSRLPLSFKGVFQRPGTTKIALPRRLDAGVGRTVGIAGVGTVASIATNVGLSHLLPDTMPSRFANAAASGAFGDIAARMAVHIAERSVAGIGTSVVRGVTEGGLLGLGTFGLDMALNQGLTNAGASHAVANTVSTGTAGAVGTAATGIMVASAGAAPETLGLSLLIGGLAAVGTTIYAGVTGAQQDEEERTQKEHIGNLIKYSSARNNFLKTLPSHNYNFQEALASFRDKASLGMDDDSWYAFSTHASTLFSTRPSNSPPPPPQSAPSSSEEERRLNELYGKYVQHNLISTICTGESDECASARTKDPGSLTDDEKKFLDEKTANTWKSQADMQVTMSVQELNYNRQRIENAQKELIRRWDEEGKTPADGTDYYLVQTANLDKDFASRFASYMTDSAMKRVIDAYYKDQTRIEQMPKSVRDMAYLNIGFRQLIHAFYADMDEASTRLKVTIPELIRLQGMERSDAVREYNDIQFDRQKEKSTDVQDARTLTDTMIRVRKAGFYDLDQAMLETDPTSIDSWKPSDSQILQAHAAGMNLNEYVEYMAELAKGEAGDYENLPEYSQDERRRIGMLDYSHFRDELQIAGYDPGLYSYNPKTRQFTRNPNISTIPSVDRRRQFISQYLPENLRRMRHDYAHMIHGLNQDAQHQVDSYNTRLLEELRAHGNEYKEMVDAQNQYIANTQRNPEHFMHFNIKDVYNLNKLTFHPLSDHMPPAGQSVQMPVSKAETTPVDTDVAPAPVEQPLDPYGGIRQDAMYVPPANTSPDEE
jgi:hypothetical protein